MAEMNPGLARRKKLREAGMRVVPANVVKVFAASEELRRILRHPNGTTFRPKLDQGVDWPNDAFTHRRIADGAVLLEGQTARPDDEGLGKRARIAARRQPQANAAPPPSPPPLAPPEAPKQRPSGK